MSELRPCVAIMAGGTGGHVFPALAVAALLRERGYDVVWLGTARGLEAQVVPANNIPLHTLTIGGLRGKGIKGYLTLPFALLRAVRQAFNWMRVLQPVCVLGMGGYAAGPGGLAAFLRGIPLVLHEQNAVAGLTNRALAPLARRVLTAYPNSLSRTLKSAIVGNPLRNDFNQVAPPQIRYAERTGPVRLLVLGGSLGAQALNEMLPQALGLAREALNELSVWHQAGRGKAQATQQQYIDAGFSSQLRVSDEQLDVEGIHVTEFIDNMADAYAWADLVVCRGGALTVSEISLVGVASVFIPFPYAVDDHQTRNAQYLVDAGAARCYQQSELTSENFAKSLVELLKSREGLMDMAQSAREAAKPHATEAVVDAIVSVIRTKK